MVFQGRPGNFLGLSFAVTASMSFAVTASNTQHTCVKVVPCKVYQTAIHLPILVFCGPVGSQFTS